MLIKNVNLKAAYYYCISLRLRWRFVPSNVLRCGWYNIYISMGIKTSIDLTRATVISSGVRVGAVLRGRRDTQISSHITIKRYINASFIHSFITESAVKNEPTFHHVIVQN